MATPIPEHVVAAVNTLLAPYGESYTPGASSSGYVSAKDAAAYLGVSKAYFYRLVKEGKLELVKLTPCHRGKAVISRAALDAFVKSKRA